VIIFSLLHFPRFVLKGARAGLGKKLGFGIGYSANSVRLREWKLVSFDREVELFFYRLLWSFLREFMRIHFLPFGKSNFFAFFSKFRLYKGKKWSFH